MEILRTPDERFKALPGFPFEQHYVEVDGLRMHYVDEGPSDAPPVLMLHGEPSWSYLYRKMIPIVAAAGLRAIAPDFVGFGRSDKLADRNDYTYRRHVDWTRGLVEKLGLAEMTLVGQDWGSLTGLLMATEDPDRYARVVIANGGILTGDQPMPQKWYAFREMIRTVPSIDIGRSIQSGCKTQLSPEVLAAYEAPFPGEEYKEAARAFPNLVPVTPEDPAAPACRATVQALTQWTKPFLTAFSDGDPITRGGDKLLQAFIPGAAGQPHTTITGAGHFLQEDKGEELAEVIVEFVAKTS
jgi:haloalkane dehalogenase